MPREGRRPSQPRRAQRKAIPASAARPPRLSLAGALVAPFSRLLPYIASRMTVTALDQWQGKTRSPLEKAQRGCDEAFAEIVKANEAMVYSICLHALRNRAQAEEVAQEVFLQLYRNLDRVESDAHVVNWLRRTATHRVIDVCRASNGSLVSLELIAEPETSGRVGDPLLRNRLRQLVGELPVTQRLVVVLRFGEEMQLSEIADALEMPVNTVKSNLRRGLARLREQLSMEGESR